MSTALNEDIGFINETLESGIDCVLSCMVQDRITVTLLLFQTIVH